MMVEMMNMDLLKVITLVMLTAYTKTFRIDRGVQDTTYKYKQCMGFSRTVGTWGQCKCKTEYTTMMCEDKKEYDCKTPKEIGCRYYLQDDKQAYLIMDSDVNERLTPNITGSNSTIRRVYIWNYDNHVGRWDDVTYEASDYFSIEYNEFTSLAISNLDIEKWKGHVIKIEFNDTNCLVLKVQGTIIYPFDVEEFKSLFRKTNTTTVPKTTTVGVLTRQPSTRGKITLAPQTGTPKVTVSPTIREKTLLPTTSHRTIATTLATRNGTSSKQYGGHTSSNTVYIIVGIVICILLGIIVLVIYRRRRPRENVSVEGHEVNKAKHKNGNVSITNGAYQPENYGKDIFLESVEEYKEPTDRPFTSNSYGNTNTEGGNINGGLDAENDMGNSSSSLPNNEAENPMYTCYVESNESRSVSESSGNTSENNDANQRSHRNGDIPSNVGEKNDCYMTLDESIRRS